ncbi:MAG TPA: hypothetical protein DDZ40_00235 [Deltaproteobacteria bacterium]|nr:hypothetical protein [Deltaproteobacteria bacterium]
MRLLICMPHYSPWAQHLAVMLQSFGHEVHIFDFVDTSNSGYVNSKISGIVSDFERFKTQVSGIHLACPPLKSKLWYALYVRRFARLAREIQAEMVLTLYGGWFALLAYLSGVRPYCVYVVGSDILLSGPVKRRINRVTLKAASRVFANGEYLAAKAQKQAPRAWIEPLLIGINTRAFQLASPPSGPVQLICTRGFQPIYNNEAILRAVARFPSEAPEFRLVFTSGGEGIRGASSLADKLIRPDLRGRIEFWGGVSYARIVEGLHNSHVFVSLSRSDGTATSLLEALACGLYPVLSDIPQNREWVSEEAANGRLVTLDDDAQLADALLYAIRISCEGRRHAELNRALVHARADAEANQRRLAKALEVARASFSRIR